MAVALSDLVTSVKELQGAVSKWYERSDIADENKRKIKQLFGEYNDGIEDLQYLSRCHELDPIDSRRLSRFKDKLQRNLEMLQALRPDVEGARFQDRVKRMGQDLQYCEEGITKFREFLSEVRTRLVCAEATSVSEDRFTSTIYVPSNPPRLTLDYNSLTTRESQLKAAVLDESSGRIVSVIAAGQGGVGKTCALRGLAEDNDIRNRFSSILYIQLSDKATRSTIVSGIAGVVAKSGGKQLALKVRGMKSVQEAAEAAKEWFKDQSCLYMVDDVWCTNDIDQKTFAALFNMVSERSRMIYTSRDQTLLRHADKVISFKADEPRGAAARAMLLRHAGISEEDLDEKGTRALSSVLDICAGLPLAIGIVGAMVWKKTQSCAPSERRHVVAHVLEDILSNQSYYMTGDNLSDYGSLVSVVDSSLRMLNKIYGIATSENLFTAFCTLPKQTEIPEEALQKLWSTGKPETRRIMGQFDDVSLVQIRHRESVKFIQIHDLILDIAAHKATRSGEYQNYFRKLIRNYAHAYQSRNQTDEFSENISTQAMPPGRRANALHALCKWAKCCYSRDGGGADTSHEHDATETVHCDKNGGKGRTTDICKVICVALFGKHEETTI